MTQQQQQNTYVFVPGEYKQFKYDWVDSGDITGIDKAELFGRLVYASLEDANWDISDEMDELLTKGLGYIDHFCGIDFRADFSGSVINTYYYNRYTQRDSLFEKIVAEMKSKDECK